MKKWIYNIGWVMMAFVTLSLTSCDDDADIARTLEGTWEGNMYASTYYNNRYYDATFSQVCFLRDPYTYSSGIGYWVDYYDNNYWGNYNYVASHIEFTVRNRVINITFLDDRKKTTVSIYDYSLSDSYFSGYIELRNGERRHFQLRHITSPNWGGYDRWGYEGYYDDYYDYYYSNENALRFSDDDDAKVDNTKAQFPEAPVRVFRDKE
jgi:hypothetical protein